MPKVPGFVSTIAQKPAPCSKTRTIRASRLTRQGRGARSKAGRSGKVKGLEAVRRPGGKLWSAKAGTLPVQPKFCFTFEIFAENSDPPPSAEHNSAGNARRRVKPGCKTIYVTAAKLTEPDLTETALPGEPGWVEEGAHSWKKAAKTTISLRMLPAHRTLPLRPRVVPT